MNGEMDAAARGRVLVCSALVVAALVPGIYLAAGGSSYTPAKVQNPCKQRPWRNPQGLQELAEQFSLSALDGAACRLHVSREELALALANDDARARFLRQHHLTDAQLVRAVRAGLLRAVDDAENAGALSPLVAAPLREAIQSLPVNQVIRLIQDARPFLEGAQGLLNQAQGLLQQFLP